MNISRRDVLTIGAVTPFASLSNVHSIPCRYVDDNNVVTTELLLEAISDFRNEKINSTTLLNVVGGWRNGVEDCVDIKQNYKVKISEINEINNV